MRDPLRLNPACKAVSFGVLFASAFGASAQTAPPTGNLANFPDLNETQRPIAIAVQQTCAGLTALNNKAPLVGEPGKLLTSCRKMVQTANVLKDRTTAPSNPLALPMTADELKKAIQAVGHEEVAIQGRSAVEAAGNNAVGVRLFALRNGARGFGMAAGGMYGSTQRSAAAVLPRGASGGGAATAPAGRLGGFLNVNYNSGRKSTTGREDGFDFDNRGATAGIDYRFTDSLVAGVAVTYSATDATIASSLGSADTRSRAISAYGSWYVSKFYVDAQLGYARNDYDTVRNIVAGGAAGFNTAATGSTRGNQWSAVLGAGYDISKGALTVTPYGRLGYLHLKIDEYTESEPNHGLALDIGSRACARCRPRSAPSSPTA